MSRFPSSMFVCRFFFRIFFLVCCFLSVSADSGIFDHVRKVEGKTEGHSIRNIDFIYMINLDFRSDKFERSSNQLKAFEITPFRFSAIDGLKLSVETINDVGVKFAPHMRKNFHASFYLTDKDVYPRAELLGKYGRTYFCGGLKRGAIGAILSHLSILKDAYESNYQTIWVMEDDIEVHQDPRVLSDLIEELDGLVGKEGWDILFTDLDTKNREGQYVPCYGMANRPDFFPEDIERFYVDQPINKHLRRKGARFGAYSLILRKSGVEKILNFYHNYQAFLPYDMDNYLPEGMRMFTPLYDIIGHCFIGQSNINSAY